MSLERDHFDRLRRRAYRAVEIDRAQAAAACARCAAEARRPVLCRPGRPWAGGRWASSGSRRALLTGATSLEGQTPSPCALGSGRKARVPGSVHCPAQTERSASAAAHGTNFGCKRAPGQDDHPRRSARSRWTSHGTALLACSRDARRSMLAALISRRSNLALPKARPVAREIRSLQAWLASLWLPRTKALRRCRLSRVCSPWDMNIPETIICHDAGLVTGCRPSGFRPLSYRLEQPRSARISAASP